MEELKAFYQTLSESLSTLAHDLNNDLGIIAGYCELMAQKAEPGSETAERLQRILTVVRRLAKRINGHDCKLAKANEAVSSIVPSKDLRH